MIDYNCVFDGACTPMNPGGHIGLGAAVYDKDKKQIWTLSEHIEANEQNTNNIAEYLSLKFLLVYFEKHKEKNIKIFGDSMLVINQMAGKWQIKKGRYTPIARLCKQMVKKQSNNYSFTWIPREKNEVADRLSKKELVRLGIKIRW